MTDQAKPSVAEATEMLHAMLFTDGEASIRVGEVVRNMAGGNLLYYIDWAQKRRWLLQIGYYRRATREGVAMVLTEYIRRME